MKRVGVCPRRRRSEDFSGRRHIVFAAIPVLLLLGACGFQRPSGQEAAGSDSTLQDPGSHIREMLLASADSWNAGDLDGFLDDYWQSAEVTFSGADGVTRGWDDLRARYLESYWAPGAARDSLRFEELEVHPLGQDHALALGRYVLYQPADEGRIAASGFFSLVLRRMADGWKIVHDHTSASPSRDSAQSDMVDQIDSGQRPSSRSF